MENKGALLWLEKWLKKNLQIVAGSQAKMIADEIRKIPVMDNLFRNEAEVSA